MNCNLLVTHFDTKIPSMWLFWSTSISGNMDGVNAARAYCSMHLGQVFTHFRQFQVFSKVSCLKISIKGVGQKPLHARVYTNTDTNFINYARCCQNRSEKGWNSSRVNWKSVGLHIFGHGNNLPAVRFLRKAWQFSFWMDDYPLGGRLTDDYPYTLHFHTHSYTFHTLIIHFIHSHTLSIHFWYTFIHSTIS